MGTATHRQLWFRHVPLRPALPAPRDVQTRAVELVRQRPFVALGVALALGALAGSLLADALSDRD